MQTLKRLFSRTSNLIIIAFLIVLGMALFTMWYSRLDLNNHGLMRVHTSDTGYPRTSNWLWMTIEGDEFTSSDGIAQVNHVQMSGDVWFGSSGEKTWRIAHTGNVTVLVDEEIIFEVTGFNELRTEEVRFTIENDYANIQILADVDINTPRTIYPYRTEFGIYEQSFLGRWSLIPAHRLYRSNIYSPRANEILAQEAQTRYYAHQFSQIIAVLTAIGLIITLFRRQQIELNSNTLSVIAIVALSLLVRFIVMVERFYNDLFFHFIVPAGDDNYVLMAQQLLSGDYDLAGTFWPSAPIVWFASIVAFFGPQLWKIYIANILLSGLATAAVTVGAWQAFDKRRIGILAGLIFALFPTLIFYQVTPQSIVLDAATVAFAFYFGILAIKHESYSYAALFGIMIALGGMSRGIILLMGLAFFLALLIRKPMTGIRLTIVTAIFSLLTLLPQNFANYQATNELSLIPYSNGEFTLYSGNNRDADGIWTGRGAAWEIEARTRQDWTGAMWEDFQQDPLRMIELNIRKISMFWNNVEYVSNVNYGQQGLGKSRLIATLSANEIVGMALLSFFVWMGMVQLISERKRENWFIFWSINALIFGTILFVLAGRLRVPVMPVLVVAAAVGLSSIWDTISSRKLSTRFIISLAIAIALSFIFPFLDSNLPRKSYISVSETAIQRDDIFNNEIRLVGFDPIQTNSQAEGYFYISLYWEILSQPSYDYRVFVELADENGRIVGVDRELGTITYPALTATQLQVGGIIQEGYLLELPTDLPDFATINVGIYAEDLEERPLVRLFDLGFDYGNNSIFDIQDEYHFFDISLNNDLFAIAFDPVLSENTLTIESWWSANRRIYEDYIIFVQILDQDGNLIVGDDSPFLDNARTTSSLRFGWYSLNRSIELPENLASGTYQIVMGSYEFPSIERLQVIERPSGELMPNNLMPLGEIVID